MGIVHESITDRRRVDVLGIGSGMRMRARRSIALGVVICGLVCIAWGRSFSYPKLVFAHYYTWYGTPEVCGEWMHWNWARHNPEHILPSGLLDTGTTDHPYKLYDSHDPALIRHHLELAKYAGIDVLIATWWGIGDYRDVAFEKLLEIIQETGSPVQATIYFEQAKDGKEGIVRDLRYIAERYFENPAFFKLNGRPVVFIYGRGLAQTPLKDWEEVLARFREKYNAIFIGDSLWGDYVSIFDGVHTYNPVIFIKRGDDMGRLYKKIVISAQLQGKISVATVIPGYNDSNIGRRNPIVVDRDEGRLYEDLWLKAIRANPDWVMITSFNEWHEGTEIEPSVEYGNFYIELTRKWAGRFKMHQGRMEVPRRKKGRVLVKLGAVNKSYGLWQLNWGDGQTIPIVIKDEPCRMAVPAEKRYKYIYFDIDDKFGGDFAIVKAKILDGDKGGEVWIEYDSRSLAYKQGKAFELHGNGGWQEFVWEIKDPWFVNRQNGGCDFRLVGTGCDLIVSQVEMILK